MMTKKILPVVLLSLLTLQIYGQSCSQRLTQAEREYEAGRLANIPTLIGDCFKSAKEGGFDKAESIRAHRILTLVHIFTDNEPEADKSLFNLLKEDPEHLLDERVDPAELFYLYDQFQTKPIFRLGFRLGTNTSFPNDFEKFTTSTAENTNKFYNGEGEGSASRTIGFMAEATFEKYLKYGLEAAGGFQYRFSSYAINNDFNDISLNNEVINTQSYLRLPVLLRYTYNYDQRGGIKPYVFIGGSFDYLLTAQYTDASREGGAPFSLNPDNGDLTSFDQVNDFNFSLTGGIGLKLPVKTNFFTVEFRYDKSFVNYIKAENRYNNQAIVFDLGHVEDNLTLDFVSFSLGWIQSIYSPKRLKGK